MLVAHHSASSVVMSSVGETSKDMSSLGTSVLVASQASYASMRATSSAGSPPSGI